MMGALFVSGRPTQDCHHLLVVKSARLHMKWHQDRLCNNEQHIKCATIWLQCAKTSIERDSTQNYRLISTHQSAKAPEKGTPQDVQWYTSRPLLTIWLTGSTAGQHNNQPQYGSYIVLRAIESWSILLIYTRGKAIFCVQGCQGVHKKFMAHPCYIIH